MPRDMPLPHGEVFGGEVEGVRWLGKFIFVPETSTWKFVYLDGYDEEVASLTGRGDTPKAAFEACVKIFIFMNGGVESPVLKALLPQLSNWFQEDGNVKLEHMFSD